MGSTIIDLALREELTLQLKKDSREILATLSKPPKIIIIARDIILKDILNQISKVYPKTKQHPYRPLDLRENNLSIWILKGNNQIDFYYDPQSKLVRTKTKDFNEEHTDFLTAFYGLSNSLEEKNPQFFTRYG